MHKMKKRSKTCFNSLHVSFVSQILSCEKFHNVIGHNNRSDDFSAKKRFNNYKYIMSEMRFTIIISVSWLKWTAWLMKCGISRSSTFFFLLVFVLDVWSCTRVTHHLPTEDGIRLGKKFITSENEILATGNLKWVVSSCFQYISRKHWVGLLLKKGGSLYVFF